MPDSTIDRKVSTWVENAENSVFERMDAAGYNRVGGAQALKFYGDWSESWENWYDGDGEG